MSKKNNFEVTLEELLEAGAHFGHQSRRWNPKMQEYLYGVREGVHIFDLVKTQKGLQEACEFLKQAVKEEKKIVFVGTKRQAQAIVKEEAKACGAHFVSERWLGGMITNWEQIEKSLKKLEEMKVKKTAGEYKKYTKKENVLIDRDIARFERFLGGLEGLKKRPDVLVVVDINREKTAVKEAVARELSVVAIVDSNCDPDLVNYVIPANDDAVRSIKLIIGTLGQAIREGKNIQTKSTKGK